jgi:MoxR-like ATPase
MNTLVYGGTYSLNEDLKSRFRLLNLDYPAPTEEKQLVQTVMGTLSPEGAKQLDHVIVLAHETRQKALEYALSPRDVVQVLEDIETTGLETALQLVLGKFDGDDKVTVKARILSIFGVTVG